MRHYELTSEIIVHTHSCGEDALFVNAYLIETRGGLVAIDATLTDTESKAIRGKIETLGKPLLAVLLTHPNPDHVAGIRSLPMSEGTKIVATEPVFDLMDQLEEPKRRNRARVYGAERVQRSTYPNVIARSGETLTFDAVTYRVLDVGPGGDSEANSIWLIDSPGRAAFVSDLVFNGMHSYVADGSLLAWLSNLARLESLCEGMPVIFPRHS